MDDFYSMFSDIQTIQSDNKQGYEDIMESLPSFPQMRELVTADKVGKFVDDFKRVTTELDEFSRSEFSDRTGLEPFSTKFKIINREKYITAAFCYVDMYKSESGEVLPVKAPLPTHYCVLSID